MNNSMSAQHMPGPGPGPWQVEATGDRFIVYRLSHWNTGWREYLTASGDVSSRASRFKTEVAANAAIASATNERDAFETWYVTEMRSAGFVHATVDEVRNLRDGDHYGAHRHMLNGKWEGWQARAAIAKATGSAAA